MQFPLRVLPQPISCTAGITPADTGHEGRGRIRLPQQTAGLARRGGHIRGRTDVARRPAPVYPKNKSPRVTRETRHERVEPGGFATIDRRTVDRCRGYGYQILPLASRLPKGKLHDDCLVAGKDTRIYPDYQNLRTGIPIPDDGYPTSAKPRRNTKLTKRILGSHYVIQEFRDGDILDKHIHE